MRLNIGVTRDGAPLELTKSDLATHLHGIGASQRGKSRLIARITRDLIKAGEGLCLIDPHGTLYEGVLNWLAYVDPQLSDIHLLDPSNTEKIVGFHPFHLAGAQTEERIMTKVDRMVEATLRVWGVAEATNAPRLERWLRCLFYIIVEQGHSLEIVRFFRRKDYAPIRAQLIQQTRSDFIREEWESLTEGRGIDAQLESTMNRLFKLIFHPTVRRIMGLRENSINLPEIIERRGVLLVNLQRSDVLSHEAGRVIGTLLLNEIGEVMSRRKHRRDFYVIIDEFQNFATPDMPYMLDELAKYGLHLILFHQRLSKLSTDLRGAMRNTDTKIIFGGVPRNELTELLEGSRATDEQLLETMEHPQRYYTLKRTMQPVTVGIAPAIRTEYVSREVEEEYRARKLAGYLTPGEVDERLASTIEQFTRPAPAVELERSPAAGESPSTQIFNNALAAEPSDEDFFE